MPPKAAQRGHTVHHQVVAAPAVTEVHRPEAAAAVAIAAADHQDQEVLVQEVHPQAADHLLHLHQEEDAKVGKYKTNLSQ